jgi:hypothetical protein
MKMTRTLADERHMLKERPDARAYIFRSRIIPDIVRLSDGRCFWDGRSARDANGDRTVFTPEMPDGVRQELRRLARIGHFGDLSKTVLDWFTWKKLRACVGSNRPGVFVGVRLLEFECRGGRMRPSLKRRR